MIYNDINVDLATCQPATKGKRFVVMLIDYFLTLIFAYSIFVFAANPIYNNLPLTKNIMQTYGEKQDKVSNIILDTGLQQKNEKGDRVSLETASVEFVKSLVRVSCNEHDMEYYLLKDGEKVVYEPVEEQLLYYKDENGNYPNYNIYHYYFFFQEQNKNDYDAVTKVTVEDINTKFYRLSDENKDLVDEGFDLSKQNLILNKEKTEKLLDYLNYKTESSLPLFSRVRYLYQSAIKPAIDEVELHYTPYITALNDFMTTHNTYARGICICMILSYLIGFLITYLVFPLFFKRGKTIGFKFFNFASTRSDMLEMRFYNFLIRDVVLFIEGLSSLFFMALFLNKLNLLSTPLMGPISLFQICLLSVFIVIVSLIFFFISKDNQALSDFASMSVVVNTQKRQESYLLEQDRKEENDGKTRSKE